MSDSFYTLCFFAPRLPLQCSDTLHSWPMHKKVCCRTV
jgi:hypothetical protein